MSYPRNMYRKGKGVAEDDVEAVKWYRKAVEQGFAGAQLNLGNMYSTATEILLLATYRHVLQKNRSTTTPSRLEFD